MIAAPGTTSVATASETFSKNGNLSFPGALAANLLNMIGIGPFITIPLALAAMGGPQALLGWIVGALLCLLDGLIWAELGSAIPRAGGPFHYLREAFGPKKLGGLFAFLYLWQTLLIGPMSIASAMVGFAHYASYIWPSLTSWRATFLAAGLCLLNTFLLWRDVRSIQTLWVVVSVIVVGACVWIILSGLPHFNASRAFSFPPHAFALGRGFWIGLGATTLIGVYDYGGYNNVCMLGDEVASPRRNIPRAVLTSIPIIAVLYLGLNLAILGVVPWRQAMASKAVVADFMQALYGPVGGTVIAGLILIASWGSGLVVLLGYSRVPYAAAVEGEFFAPFARRDLRRRFPTVSLLFMGVASALACVVSLDDLIAILIVMQTLFQYIAQCFAVVILRLRRSPLQLDQFRMPLYPLPVILTMIGWLYIIGTSRLVHIVAAITMLGLGSSFFFSVAYARNKWPFKR